MKNTSAAGTLAGLLVGIWLLLALVSAGRQDWAFYHDSVDHPWNRLHGTLVLRRAKSGRLFGANEVDPLLWPDTLHLLDGRSHARALRVLDEFLDKNEHRLCDAPLNRAVLQHDLWGLFDWLADPELDLRLDRRRALSRRVAQVIDRLALSSDEIQALPDNYAAVISSQQTRTAGKPLSVLPPSLGDAAGPWIQLGYRRTDRIGTAHEENVATKGRSAFLLFVRLPDSSSQRQVLTRFNAWADVEAGRDVEIRRRLGYPSFEFPAGTQLALVRRMLVIDDQGQVRGTRITERVQLRELLAATPQQQPLDRPQAFALFALRREALLAGELHQSLQRVGADERGFELGPVRTPVHGDPFQSVSAVRPPTVVMTSCAGCHKDHSLLSLSHDKFSSLGSRPANLGLQVLPVPGATATVAWKSSQPEFKLLRQLIDK